MRSSDRTTAVLERYASVDALPPDAEALFAANPGVFNSQAWWRTVLAFGMAPGSEAVFLLCRLGGAPAGLLPLYRSPDGRLAALTTPYTCLYQPLLAASLDAASQRAVFAAFAAACRDSAWTWFDALDADWSGLPHWIAAARQAGLFVLRFDGFGNWHEPVVERGWPAYLAGRPGALRETIRRRLRRVEQDQRARFRLLRQPEEIEAGVAAYEDVYARSWKQAEPFPRFNAALIRAGAGAGWLRLGVLDIGDRPVAAQLWTVDQGVATVLKLCHDEAFKTLSPGTALTAWMLRHLLDQEQVSGIDFGRGDDGYKQGWAGQRRQRIGLVLVNPWRRAGLAMLIRHALGRAAARLPAGLRARRG